MCITMQDQILSSVLEAQAAIKQLQSPESMAFIDGVSKLLAETFEEGNKVIIAGNGGSLCDSMHFAEELTGYFRNARRALPAIALSEPGHLTCVGNDVGFESVFSRGVEAYGQAGDLFIGLSTSGNSANIIRAVEMARSRGLNVVTFLGAGGKLKGAGDFELMIDGFASSDRVQEAHMSAIHIIIEMMEARLFSGQTQVHYV